MANTHKGPGLIWVAGYTDDVTADLHTNADGTWAGYLKFAQGSTAEMLLRDAMDEPEGPPTLFLNGASTGPPSEIRVVDVGIHAADIARIVGVGPKPF